MIVRGRQFRQLVKDHLEEISSDKTLLTLLGERIAHYFPHGTDRYEEDGMAIVVKLLAKSADEQLLQYIKTVALNSGSGKATDVAKSYLDNNDTELLEEENINEDEVHAEAAE